MKQTYLITGSFHINLSVYTFVERGHPKFMVMSEIIHPGLRVALPILFPSFGAVTETVEKRVLHIDMAVSPVE
jgi:hypothetical protein